MCCCDGKGLKSVSPTFRPKRDQDLPLSFLGARRIFKMGLKTREERKRVQKEEERISCNVCLSLHSEVNLMEN